MKWFSDAKGFGFITADDGSIDVFVRHTAISSEGFRSFSEEGKVAFEAEQATPKACANALKTSWEMHRIFVSMRMIYANAALSCRGGIAQRD